MSFRPHKSRNAALAVTVFAGAMAGDAGAQEAANPAVPLHEVHGSWQLACAAPVKKDPADPNTTETAPAKPLCAIAQVQLEEKPANLSSRSNSGLMIPKRRDSFQAPSSCRSVWLSPSSFR